MIRNLSLALMLLLMLAAGTAVAQENVIDRIVAVVDNEVILESELWQYVQFQMGSQNALENLSPSQVDSLKRIVLDELIKQKVLLAKARLDTVQIETRIIDAELDSRIKALIDQAGGQDRLEEYYGMPLVKLKRQFRPLVEEGMMIDRVRQEKLRGVQVGPNEVNRFWETYKDSIPPLRDGVRLSHILLTDRISEKSIEAAERKADSVRALVTSGAVTFEEYASRNSDDVATKAKGGRLGITNRGDLVAEYESVAYALKPGEISPPTVSPFGVHLIRLDERLGEKINTSHILFKIAPAEEDLSLTEQRGDSIAEAVRGGADWAALVQQYSADAKTVTTGGDLGWFAPEEVPVDFAASIKDLKKGELAPPVRTRFGAHVVRVTDRMYARPVSLTDDYDRISRLALAKKQDEIYGRWISDLSAETYIERK